MKKLNEKQLEKELENLHRLGNWGFNTKKYHKHGIIIKMASIKDFKTLIKRFKNYDIEVGDLGKFGAINEVKFRYWIMRGECECRYYDCEFPFVEEGGGYFIINSNKVNCLI